MSSKKQHKQQSPSTLAALLRDKPKRGRPPQAVGRQNVYISLSQEQKKEIEYLIGKLPATVHRSDLPDLAISVLAARLEALHRAVADRNREIPEGVTDLESLYLLWDIPLPINQSDQKWTSIRLSPQQVIELGRAHGTLHAVFGTNRSQTYALAISLFKQFSEQHLHNDTITLAELRKKIFDIYL